MSELSKAYFDLKNVTNEKMMAKVDHEAAKAEKKQTIERLKAELRDSDFEFENHWSGEKEKRQAVVDELAMAELAKGTKATAILKLLESRNTVWIYSLKRKVDEGHKPVEPEVKPTEDEGEWRYHDHKGVHSYAFSDDFSKIKKHGIIGTPDEGTSFVATYGLSEPIEFLYGDRELFDKTPKGELRKRAQMLDELLNGAYEGKIVAAENPYKKL